MSTKKYLIVIGGPTASGKTTFAIEIARHFNTEIISCDSRQFYREMAIGTAKPSHEELSLVKHHFVDSLSIENEYSVGDFEKQTLNLLDQLFKEKDYAVMCGGSGLFINAVCFGLDSFPAVPPEIRNAVEKEFEATGIGPLQKELQEKDPDYFSEMDIQNPHRLMRAIEVIRHTGQPFSSFRQGRALKRSFQPVFLQLHHPRQTLYDRINFRVDQMMDAGLLDEAKSLYSNKKLNALQTVGYQEIFAYLDGTHSLERAIELIKQNSRRYAKRQITWMRRDGFWKHFRPDEIAYAQEYIQMIIRQDLKLKSAELSDLNIQSDPTCDDKAKVCCAYLREALAGYFAYEVRPKKSRWHPVQMLDPDGAVEQLLQHEQNLLKEEIGIK